jgi:hypothetical protein
MSWYTDEAILSIMKLRIAFKKQRKKEYYEMHIPRIKTKDTKG